MPGVMLVKLSCGARWWAEFFSKTRRALCMTDRIIGIIETITDRVYRDYYKSALYIYPPPQEGDVVKVTDQSDAEW